MKSSPPNLAIALGCACILAIIVFDYQLPNIRNQTELSSNLFPAARQAASHQYTTLYGGTTGDNGTSIKGGSPGNADSGSGDTFGGGNSHSNGGSSNTENWLGNPVLSHSEVAYIADRAISTSSHSFPYPPLWSLALAPLAGLPQPMALITWQGLSLLALSYCVFLTGKAASRIDAASGESEHSGWLALMFFPILLSLWTGSGDIIFGILPLTFGYYYAMTKKFATAGLFFALCLCKPACLLPGFVTAFALLTHKRPRCMGGLILCLAILIGANATLSWTAFTSWLGTLTPNYHLNFAQEQTKPLMSYIANLPQALLVMVPDERQMGLSSLALLLSGALLLLALHQIMQMQKSLKEDYQIVPLSFVTGLYLIPLVIPGGTYGDLSILVLAGLVVASLEWRKFSDWRLKTTVRVTAIAINAFALLVLFKAEYAYPLILIAVLIIYFRRIVEAVHLAASEHGGVVQVFADAQEEFLD